MEIIWGIVFGVCFITIFLILRLLIVVWSGLKCKPGKKGSVSVLIVAGSGGHTTEMLRLLENLSQAYVPRHYIIADTDKMSEDKIRFLEASRREKDGEQKFTIHRIPRSREVQQSWSSSVLTTLHSLVYSMPLVFKLRPDLILTYYTQTKSIHETGSHTATLHTQSNKVLCNGPGTCVPLCVSALLLGVLGVKKVLIVYVESICRVETLSLSGKILYHLSDYFLVQWLSLQEKYPKSVYIGRTV